MANLIKCPKCPLHLDATGQAPGSALQCPNCGAGVRIPTGQTGQVPAVKQVAPGLKPPTGPVKAVAPAPKPVTQAAIPVAQPVEEEEPPKIQTGVRRAATGSTPVFRKAAGSRGGRGTGERGAAVPNKKSNTPIIVGVVVVVAAVIGVVIFMVGGKKSSGPVVKKPDKYADLDPSQYSDKRSMKDVAPPPPPPPKDAKPVMNELDGGVDPVKAKEEEDRKKAEAEAQAKKDEALKQQASKDNSASFKTGAQEQLPPNYKPKLDASKLRETDDVIRRESASVLVDKWPDHFDQVVWRCLSDDEKVAKFCIKALEEILDKKLSVKDGDQALRFPWDKFDDPHVRAGFIATVMHWVKDNRAWYDALAAGKDPTNLRVEDKTPVDTLPWDRWMSALSHYSILEGGKLGYPKDAPEYPISQQLEKLGKDAYPYLLKFVAGDDPNWAKGAVVALRNLTGITGALPKNPEEGKAVQAKYMKELGISEADIPK
jgi:hypothetical protein